MVHTSNLGGSALIGTAITAPLVVLEIATGLEGGAATRDGYWVGVTAMSAVLWLLALGGVSIIKTLVRDFTFAGYVAAHPMRVASRFVLLAVVATAYVVILVDQGPCLPGLANCD